MYHESYFPIYSRRAYQKRGTAMSYDIYLNAEKCPHCGSPGSSPDNLPNPTYNLTPIFDLALTGEGLPNPDVAEVAVVLFRKETDRPRGLRVLSGRKAGETVEKIRAAVARMKDPALRERFIALQPENGWGDLAGAEKVMGILLQTAEEYPACTWEIH